MIRVCGEETVKAHNRANGTQAGSLAAIDRFDLGRGAFHFGALHLRGDCPLPDQVVNLGHVVIKKLPHLLGMPEEISRTDGFVCFLRVLGLVGKIARLLGNIFVAEFSCDHAAGALDGFGSHLHAVGSHIGDKTHSLAADVDALVELLGNLHRAVWRIAELAGGGLLQG